MSDLRTQIPRFEAAFDALENGNIRTFTDLVQEQAHPDCEFRSGIGSVVGGGSYKGPEGIRDWFGDLLASTAERRWRNRRYEFPRDDVLLYLADFEFTGAASGATVESETGAVFEYADGLCVRINSFMSHDEAREYAEARVA